MINAKILVEIKTNRVLYIVSEFDTISVGTLRTKIGSEMIQGMTHSTVYAVGNVKTDLKIGRQEKLSYYDKSKRKITLTK